MKRATKFFAVILSLIMITCFFPAAQTAFAAEAESMATSAGVVTIHVTAEDLDIDPYYAIQNALSLAEDAGGDMFYKIVVAPGDYYLSYALTIHSNTCLSLYGVTLRRNGTANMLIAGGNRYEAEGYCYRNITVEGGTFDGNGGTGTMIKLAHAKNVTLKNVTVKNNRNTHMIETAAIDGFTVTGCNFSDQVSTSKDGYEVIQLDVLKSGNFNGYRAEDLSMRNVLVENCTFNNCPRGVGSHTAVLNNPHRNIVIRNNTFIDLTSVAVEGYNWVDCYITGNIIDNAPRAIALYTAGNGTYTSASIADEGGTTPHYEDVKPTYWTNGYIENNVITNCGLTEDQYESGRERSAISVMGVNITGGSIPAGEYTCINVAVRHNAIQMKGNGIRAEYARNLVIQGNEIKSLGTANANDYGVVIRKNTTNAYINKNYITDIPVNGIQIAESCNVKQVVLNELYRMGKYGIGVYTSTVSLINNNEIRDTQSDGILAHSGAHVDKITENRLMRTGSTAIHITSEASAGTIERNTVYRCSGSQPGGNNYTSAGSLSSVTPSDSSVTLAKGEKYRVTKTLSPVSSLYDFTYTSSDTSVATVDNAGLVTALSAGTATVKATATNGKSCSVVINVPAEKVLSVSGTVTVGNSGESAQLVLIPEDDSAPVFTDAAPDGTYMFDNIAAGRYTLSVSKYDCVAVEAEFEIDADSVVLDISLRMIGDLSGDGIINVEDATVLQRHLAEFTNADGSPIVDEDDPAAFRAADFNGDGVIDIVDVTDIQRRLAEYI